METETETISKTQSAVEVVAAAEERHERGADHFSVSRDTIVEAYVPSTPEERALVRKVDLKLLPIIWGCYVFNYLDRTNIGNARIAGLQSDLKMSDDQYQWALSIFFFGYLLMEVPSNMILTASIIQPSRFLPGIMLTWGTLCSLVTVVHSYHGLLALRFILGCIEAGFFPGVLFLMSSWYKKSELSRRVAFFYSAAIISGALGGLLAGAITTHLDGNRGIRGWRWLFLVEGIATIFMSILAFLILPDFPSDEKSLSSQERSLALSRLTNDGDEGLGSVPISRLQAFKMAVTDWRTWCFALLYVLDLGAGTISYFIPTLTKSLDFGNPQYMTIPIYLLAAFFCITAAFSSDKTKDRCLHITFALSVAFIASMVALFIQNSTTRYVMLMFMAGGIWTSVPLILTWTSNTVSVPAEKRAIVLALVNSLGNLSSVYGSRIWPSSSGPEFRLGFGVTAGFVGAGAIVAAVLGAALRRWPYKVRMRSGNGRREEDANVSFHISSHRGNMGQ